MSWAGCGQSSACPEFPASGSSPLFLSKSPPRFWPPFVTFRPLLFPRFDERPLTRRR